MSYRSAGLGTLSSETYGSGTQLVGGYGITGLTRPPGEVPGLLRQALASFPGASVARVGWGGGSDAAGVPGGHVYAVMEVTRSGLTADEANRAFSAAAAALQALSGGRVTNTHAHVARRAAAAATTGTTGGKGGGTSPSDFLTAFTSTPSYTPDTTTPYAYESEPTSFFTTTYGGIPGWGLTVGGVLLLGGLGYMAMQSRRAVKANRRRRVRRNTGAGRKRRRHVARPIYVARAPYSVGGRGWALFTDPDADALDLLPGTPFYKTKAEAQREGRKLMKANRRRRVRRNTGKKRGTKSPSAGHWMGAYSLYSSAVGLHKKRHVSKSDAAARKRVRREEGGFSGRSGVLDNRRRRVRRNTGFYRTGDRVHVKGMGPGTVVEVAGTTTKVRTDMNARGAKWFPLSSITRL